MDKAYFTALTQITLFNLFVNVERRYEILNFLKPATIMMETSH